MWPSSRKGRRLFLLKMEAVGETLPQSAEQQSNDHTTNIGSGTADISKLGDDGLGELAVDAAALQTPSDTREQRILSRRARIEVKRRSPGTTGAGAHGHGGGGKSVSTRS